MEERIFIVSLTHFGLLSIISCYIYQFGVVYSTSVIRDTKALRKQVMKEPAKKGFQFNFILDSHYRLKPGLPVGGSRGTRQGEGSVIGLLWERDKTKVTKLIPFLYKVPPGGYGALQLATSFSLFINFIILLDRNMPIVDIPISSMNC
uniref:Uncharacterized protein n=1 Tax=Rhodnius prolixus TaxID=13249 RepID=T1IAX1_RHOPR